MVAAISHSGSAVLGLALMVSCQKPAEPVTTTTTEEPPAPPVDSDVSTRPPLTGIPQIDYIWDPNLPRELNGYNMSDYPFLRSIPKEIEFKCDGLHDGFYASIPLKCQVYHQCLFGQRYDFLCANFTAFDQKIFNCQFVSEVDCENSHLFYDRNEALYKTTSTTPAPLPIRGRFAAEGRRRRPNGGRRRRPQRPIYYDDYYDYDYEEDEDVPGNGDEAQEEEQQAPLKSEGESNKGEPVQQGETAAAKPKSGRQRQGQNRFSVFNNNRPAPRIRPPVPNNVAESSQEGQQPKKGKKKPTTPAPPEEEFEEDEEEEAPPTPPPTKRPKGRKSRPTTTTTTTTQKPQEEDYEYYDDEEVTTTTTTQRPRKAKMTSAPTTTTTTVATTTTTTEEPELPSKPNPSLFVNRKGVPNVLKRRIPLNSKTTAPPQEEEEDEEFEDEEEVPQTPTTTKTTTTTTTTTTAPRRTTASRPPRPAPNQVQRSRVATTIAPVAQEAEEEATVAQGAASQSRPQAEPVGEEVTPPARAPSGTRGRIRPNNPTKRDDAAVVSDQGFVTQDETQPEGDETSRQGRDLELSDDDDEELAESQQWSVLGLFSGLLPQRH